MKKVTKKVVKKEAHTWKSPKKDQYTVVLEDLRSHFKAFGENLDFVREDVSGLKTDVSSLKTDVAELKTDVSSLKTDVAELKNTSRIHTEMIGRMMIDVEDIKSGMREKVDRRDFDKLEKRLVVLETAFFTGKR